MLIQYWSDFSCPFCYIGITRLERILQELHIEDAEIQMKAFQLEPYRMESHRMPTVELFMRKYRMPEEVAIAQVQKIHDAGIAEGLDLHYENPCAANTMDAHRLVKLAQDKYSQDIANQLAKRFYKSFFAEYADLADKSLLTAHAEACGISSADIQQVLTSMDYRNVVYVEQNEVQKKGVSLVPHFIIDRQVEVSGAQSDEAFKEAIAKALQP